MAVERVWGCISGAGIARIAAGFEEGEWESKATQAILEVARRGANSPPSIMFWRWTRCSACGTRPATGRKAILRDRPSLS